MRALCYCRQSDSRGAGADSLSIDSMVTELTRWCEAEGWEIVAVIREPDSKGWQDETQRPGLAEALDLARARAYDLLLVFSMDRFARSVRIQEDLIYRLASLGVEVRSKTEPHLNRSPMVRQIIGAVSEERTREISKHIRRALQEKTRQGRWHGPTPYGFERGRDGRLVPVEEESPVVAEIVQRGASDESWWAIAHDLNQRGIGMRGAPWSHRTTRGVAINPVHIGVCWAGDVATEGAHPAIINRQEWERCQDRIRSNRRAKRRGSHPTFLAGRAYCGCGWPMYAIPTTNGSRQPIVLLRCRAMNSRGDTCAQPRRAIYLATAERFVRAQLADDLERAVSWREALAEAKAEQRRVAPSVVSERTRLEATRKRLEARRSRLVDAFADGVITRSDLAERVAPIDVELAEVAAALADAPAMPDPATFKEAGALIAAARVAVATATDEAMAGLLAMLGATVHLEGDGLRLRYGVPFDRMLGGG